MRKLAQGLGTMVLLLLAAVVSFTAFAAADDVYAGFTELDGKTYYFNEETHELFTPEEDGFFEIGGNHYYFYTDGSVKTVETSGLADVDGVYYYFYAPESNIFVPETSGVYTVDAVPYFFYDDAHVEFTGEAHRFTAGEKLYYADATGALQSGWIAADGEKYFAGKDFVLLTGKQKSYCFDAEGKLLTGLQTVDGKLYYYAPKNGKMTTGWVTIKKDKYYFKAKTGESAHGLTKIGKAAYYFDEQTGKMLTGWVTDASGKYYFSAKTGAAMTGLTRISKVYYFFSAKNYKLKTGWVTIGDTKHYFTKKTGAAATGITKIGSKTYCFGTDGAMLTGVQTVGGKTYYFSPKTGTMTTGWVTVDGDKYYYLPKTGEAAKDWTSVNGSYYYFGADGKMCKSTIVGDYYVLSDGKRATSSAVKYAVSVVNAVSKPGMTAYQKLNACYYWCMRNINYTRDHTNPAKLNYDWRQSYATTAFSKRVGNCYKYASAFGYCARVLGYNARVAIGQISSNHGMTAHGWTEIIIGNTTYICDTVQQRYYGGNFWMRTYSNYPKRLAKSGSYSINLY